MEGERKQYRSASQTEVDTILDQIAAQTRADGGDYFTLQKVKAALKDAGLSESVNVGGIRGLSGYVKQRFNSQSFGFEPKLKNPDLSNVIAGARVDPSVSQALGYKTVNESGVIESGRRPGGQRKGGIGPKAPR